MEDYYLKKTEKYKGCILKFHKDSWGWYLVDIYDKFDNWTHIPSPYYRTKASAFREAKRLINEKKSVPVAMRGKKRKKKR